MKRVLRTLLLTFMGLQASASGAAQIGPDDAGAIRAVIEAQLKAMAEDDAALAFSYASPSIRMQFGDAPSFMTMVREGYPMLIQASETFFAGPRAADDGAMQAVHLRDQDGRAWVATYYMQQQSDKSWRINGCMVEPDADNSSA